MSYSGSRGFFDAAVTMDSEGRGPPCVRLSGAWNLRGLERRAAELASQLGRYAADARTQWDLSEVAVLDHAGALMLWRAWGRRRAPLLTLKPEHEALFNHLTVSVAQ